MYRTHLQNRKHQQWTSIAILTLLLSTPVVAATHKATGAPGPGGYCPSPDILLVTAEELSTGLDLVMRSRASFVNNHQRMAINQLASAGTVLNLAASRGASARTIQLLDAVMEARTAKDYPQMLTWFPVLHTSLITLPDSAVARAADDQVGNAEEIMQGLEDGDPLQHLSEARHLLACDGMDIPLHSALRAQGRLLGQLTQRNPPKKDAYDRLLVSLRSALAYSLGHGKE